jgi:leucine-zipper-like transcriptional regulator 1
LNGVMYIFGGFDGTTRVNTFHAFSFAEKRWSPVWPAADSLAPPSPRDRHVAATYGTCFYIHGGFDGRSRVSDFWSFDLSSMTWREINGANPTAGRAPSARHSHSAVVHGHSLYIAFGYDGSYKNDVHEFDFAQSRWSAVPAAGRRPRPRYRATAVVHKNYMIVYGGHDGVRHLSDTHVLDLETKTWAPLATEGTPPVPRDSHLSVMYQDSMFVFAGSSGSAMKDLHELQLLPPTSPHASEPAPARWRAVNASSRGLQPRHRFCHVGVVYSNSLYVFGGYDGGDRLNDFVRFDFTVYDLSFEVPQPTIISDLRAMINNSTMSDIAFIVEGQRVYAHKLILMRCSYFQALFLGEMRESRMDEISLPPVGHAVFLSILEYLYTDQLKIPLHLAMEIFEAADLFCIPRLRTMCEKRMLQSINIENAAAIFHASDMHSASALRQKSKKFILSNFQQVSVSRGFEEMGRNNVELVFELLRSR